MLYRVFALYITYYLVLAIDPESASGDESASNINSNPEDSTQSEDIMSLVKNVMNEANSANASQSLLELVELAKNATVDGTNDLRNKKLPSRRFLHWFKEVISNYTSTTPMPVYNTPNPSYDEQPQMKSIYDEKLSQNLTSVLKYLTQVLEKLNRNIEEQISRNPLTVQPLKPIDNSVRRSKREAPKAGHELKTANATNYTESTPPPSKTISLTPPPNPSSTSQDGLQEPNPCAPAPDKTRRSNRNSVPEIKEKLLKYLNDIFQEIETKIQPVQEIKQNYATDELFRIGYIIANIDTLEVSIVNLREDTDIHSSQWEDKKILDMFDKMMVSNRIVTNLIESLHELLDKTKGSESH